MKNSQCHDSSRREILYGWNAWHRWAGLLCLNMKYGHLISDHCLAVQLLMHCLECHGDWILSWTLEARLPGDPLSPPKPRPPLVPWSVNLEPISSHIHTFFFIPFPPPPKTTCWCNILEFYYIQSKYNLCKLYEHDWPYSSVLIYFLTHLICTHVKFSLHVLLTQLHQFHLPVILPWGHQQLGIRASEILRWCCYLFAYSSTDMGQAGRRQSFLREPGPSKTWLLDWQVSLFQWRCTNVRACVFLHTTQWGPKRFSTNKVRTYLQVLTTLKAV